MPSPREIIESRLATINHSDLEVLVNLSTIGRILGIDINPESLGSYSIPPIPGSDESNKILNVALAAKLIADADQALMNADMDGVYAATSAVLDLASKDEAAAIFAYGMSLSFAMMGPTSAGVAYEAGVCPNGTPDCPVNAYADALYMLAKEAGDKHGIVIPDLGVTERRFSDTTQVRAYIEERAADATLRMLSTMVGGGSPFGGADPFGAPKPDDGGFGGGAWN